MPADTAGILVISQFCTSVIDRSEHTGYNIKYQMILYGEYAMKLIREVRCLCPGCMEEHDVSVVETEETDIFKGEQVCYPAHYHYCANSDELYETEDQMSANDTAMKDAYRRKTGLLTSGDIISIRQKFGISQSDLALLLGWGEKTITRYEGHQVQDAAHDSILRKIDNDPEWYLELLDDCQKKHPLSSYRKYHETALILFEKQRDRYLQKSILGAYAKYLCPDECNGYTEPDLKKTVDAIRYFSNSEKVRALYKTKLMIMLWYSDTLSFKIRNRAITGLVYKASPAGAVPVASDMIIGLSGIRYEEVDFDEGTGCHFISDGVEEYPSLDMDDKTVLDRIIDRFGDAGIKEITESMNRKEAYIETETSDVIRYQQAGQLPI